MVNLFYLVIVFIAGEVLGGAVILVLKADHYTVGRMKDNLLAGLVIFHMFLLYLLAKICINQLEIIIR